MSAAARARPAALAAASAALLLLPACSGDSTSPPAAPGPLRFAPSVRVGGLCCLLYEPRIAADGALVYVGWTEAIRFTTYLPLVRSSDGGASFPDRLDFSDATGGDRRRIRIAALPGRGLALAWEDSRDGFCDPFCHGYRVYSAHSADAGEHFAPNRPIDASDGTGSSAPTLAVAGGGAVYAAWVRFQAGRSAIAVSRSPDGGETYGPGVAVDGGDGAPRDQRAPAIAVRPDERIHVAWIDRRSGDAAVYLATSDDRGATFRAGPLHASDPQVSDRDAPGLAVTGAGRLVAIWTERRGGVWRVQYATSLDGGASFTTPRAVDGARPLAGDQIAPALVAEGEAAVYVAWQEVRDAGDRVRAARSTNGGDDFEASVVVDDTGSPDGDQRTPALAAALDGVLVTWMDFSRPEGGVYLARSAR